MKVIRKANGSMLVLMIFSMGLIILMAIAGIIFNSFLFQNSRSQDKMDALALRLASIINAGNRVGQMNETEDRCRELVYISRQTRRACDYGEFGYLAPLCDQLLREARDGQQLVEDERKNQIALIRKEVQDATTNYNAGRNTNSTLSLNWLRTFEPHAVEVSLGTIKDVQSNVRCQRVFRGLAYYDYRAGYFNPANGLYKANIDARLPDADADLDFKLSALPASVGNVTAQPRNTNSNVFIPYAKVVEDGVSAPNSIADIPNSVQVSCTMSALVGPKQNNEVSVREVSTAITSGASPELED